MGRSLKTYDRMQALRLAVDVLLSLLKYRGTDASWEPFEGTGFLYPDEGKEVGMPEREWPWVDGEESASERPLPEPTQEAQPTERGEAPELMFQPAEPAWRPDADLTSPVSRQPTEARKTTTRKSPKRVAAGKKASATRKRTAKKAASTRKRTAARKTTTRKTVRKSRSRKPG